MRHWCAVTRLIKTKVETGNFDVFTVRNWLGHEKITTTEGYIRYTEQYYQQLPEDWISLILKPRRKRFLNNGCKNQQLTIFNYVISI